MLISTGEVSGDLQGSFLVKALIKESKRRSIPLKIIALGGSRMQDAGAELITNTSSIGAIGFWEVLPYLIPTLKAQFRVDRLLVEQPPDALVLIDYMGPNIRLGNKARKLLPSLPIIYYIAPQEWAWRLGDSGSTDLIGFSTKILAIFKKEADFYSSRGGKVSWVGHPMLDNLKELPQRDEACQKLGLDPSCKFLLVLPASRSQELRYLLPTLLKAAALIQANDPSLVVLLPAGQESFEPYLEQALSDFGVIGKVFPAKDTDRLKSYIFQVSDLALAKSGTINMELALHLVPQIVGYKVSRVTAFIAKRFLNFSVDHISPVNLLLNERLVPELVQKEFTANSIVKAAIPLLKNSIERSRMLKGYHKLRENLGENGVTDRAANEILDSFI
ncbi:Lipid-A-disaccharide synthase [Prochlorococcus sp. SS52]|nr:Lipid-A-disaccharide synthase [Prochlorococcus marinus str. LG]KGG37407.1 Lipid-A-disaccharide synthase [Prochlorococcus sp. SS52]